MDRGVAVVSYHLLGDQDRILEVVAVPRHEGDGHVLTQCQLADIGRGAVSHHVTTRNQVTYLHDRTLVDVGVLVGTGEFGQVVDVYTHFTGHGFFVVHAYHNTVRINVVHHTATTGDHGGTRIDSHIALDTGTHEGFFRAQARYGLTLHVGAHQGTVCIVMLQERNQRGRNGYHLAGRHVHVLYAVWRSQNGFAFFTASHQLVDQVTGFVQLGVGLGDHVAAFFDGGQVIDLVGYLAINDLAVRGFQETELVGTCVHGQRVDQTDVRAFRRFDRAHAAVVGRVYVTHFEAGAFAGQTTRAQGRYTALVGHFGQRVGLIHELRQLAGAEEFLDRGRNRLGVDQVMRHQVVGFSLVQTLFHGTLNTYQASAELVLGQFAYRTHTTVAQVIDIVHFATAVTQFAQDGNHGNNVFGRQHAVGHVTTVAELLTDQGLEPLRRFLVELVLESTGVELHAANTGQVVAVFVEEQALEQLLYGVFCWRLAWAHHAVDGHAGRQLVGGIVTTQGLRDVATVIQIVDVQNVDFGHVLNVHLGQQIVSNLFVGTRDDFAGFRVHHVIGQHLAYQHVKRHFDTVQVGRNDIANVLGSNALVLGNNQLAVFADDIELGNLALQALGYHFHEHAVAGEIESIGIVELGQNAFVGVAQCLQQDGHRHFATTVDTEEQLILGIELEVQPRAAVRNHASGEQQFTGRMRFAAVVLEEHARGTVQLGNDDTLGPVDNERPVRSHQGDFTHVHFVFAHFFYNRLGRFFVQNGQADTCTQWRCKGNAAQLAFLNIERRVAQYVMHKVQTCKTIVTVDREDRLECSLQAYILALIKRHTQLEKLGVRIDLGRQQEWDVENSITLRKTFTNTLLLSKRITHRVSIMGGWRKKPNVSNHAQLEC